MGVDEHTAAAPPQPTNNTCSQKVKARIKKHWTVPPKHRTPEQDEAEEHLITFYLGKNRYLSVPGIKFSRWYLFFASFLVQFCIGSLYSWSVFNKPIDLHVYGTVKAEKAVNAFYTAVGVFGTTTAIMGPWIERHGPRAGVVLGTSAFLIGNIIVAISLHFKAIAGVYIGYGVFCGFGMGLCYISPVSALQKWFPDYRGTAAGFAVGGYGAGSVVWGKAYLPIIKHVGLSSTFLVVGFVMATTMYICAIVLRSPHHEFTVSGLNIHGEAVEEAEEASRRGEKLSVMSAHEYESITTPSAKDMQDVVEPTTSANTQVRKLTLIGAIKTIDFMFMYIMFFANQLFGLIVLSKLSSMCVDLFGKTADQGADIVSINGVFNCCGRLLFPAISDVLIRILKVEPAQGRKIIFHYTLASQMLIVGTIPYLIRHDKYTLFCIEVFILTASYGGGFGTIPCFLTDMFGAFNIGAMHGLILTAWSIGGVVGGITFNSAFRNAIAAGTSAGEAYIHNIHKIFVVIIIGFFVIFLVRTNPDDRFAPGYRYSVCGKTVVNIKSKKQQQDQGALLLSPA
ncbi:Major facilitator superfamily, partial [Globisporangium splendens]